MLFLCCPPCLGFLSLFLIPVKACSSLQTWLRHQLLLKPESSSSIWFPPLSQDPCYIILALAHVLRSLFRESLECLPFSLLLPLPNPKSRLQIPSLLSVPSSEFLRSLLIPVISTLSSHTWHFIMKRSTIQKPERIPPYALHLDSILLTPFALSVLPLFFSLNYLKLQMQC